MSLQEKFKPPLRKGNNISWWNIAEAQRIMKRCISSLPAQGKSLTLWALEVVETSKPALNLKVTLSSTRRSFCRPQNIACMHFLNKDKIESMDFLSVFRWLYVWKNSDFIPLKFFCYFTRNWLLSTIRGQDFFRQSRIAWWISILKFSANVLVTGGHRKPRSKLFKTASQTGAVFLIEDLWQLLTAICSLFWCSLQGFQG